MHVHFVLPAEKNLGALDKLDADRDWREFVTTTRAWVLQTYLRLKAAGEAASLRSEFPDDGIAIFSTGDYRLVRRQRTRTRALLVAASGSHWRVPYFADLELVQNPTLAGRTRIFMPHWPQPGLVPRDSARGTGIRRIAFKGLAGNLDPAFLGCEWRDFLAQHGIDWVNDSIEYAGLETVAAELRWNDFSDIDLIVAMRPHDPALWPGRPATKLVNAWIAGVPALIGPELACRTLRRHPDDYVEVESRADAQRAVLELLANPVRYRAMQNRAQLRASECNVASVLQQWRTLLFDTLPDLVRQNRLGRRAGRPLWLRELSGRMRSALARPLPRTSSR